MLALRILSLAIAAAVLAGSPAFAAVAGVGVGVRAEAGGAGNDEAQAKQAGAAVGRADLVAVVKVTEIVDPQQQAEAEGQNKDKEKAKDENQPAPAQIMWAGQVQSSERLVSAEVSEVLRGDRELKQVKFKIMVSKSGNQEMLVLSNQVDNRAGGRIMKMSVSRSVPLTLAKGKEALVFLKVAGEKKDKDGKVTERIFALLPPALDGVPEKAAAAAREAVKKLTDWDNPPKLAAEEETAVKKLLAELGSEDFATREAATKALIAKGGAVKPYAEAALKSADPEVVTRAGNVLEGIKPESLKTDSSAGDSGMMILDGGAVMRMEVQGAAE